MTTTRDQIVETACRLMETQGYHATGLNQIVRESGAPKGSLYYYFPEGKEEIAAEALIQSGRMLAERTREGLAQITDPAGAVRALAAMIAHYIEASGFQAGGPLQAVTVETAATNPRLNLACREAYQMLQTVFEEKLAASGFSAQRAAELAVFFMAAVEGGIVLSRAYHSGDPLRRVGEELAQVIGAAKI
jgi:TetR/AcrR family transcriptional regulator, lmrAB and yxaGH operons repressor